MRAISGWDWEQTVSRSNNYLRTLPTTNEAIRSAMIAATFLVIYAPASGERRLNNADFGMAGRFVPKMALLKALPKNLRCEALKPILIKKD